MQWLHISDIHFGCSSSTQKIAAGSLIDFLRENDSFRTEKFEAIFLAGDIVYSGTESEYDSFEETFLKPLQSIPAFSEAKIYAVPGNHDIDCEASMPITWEGIRPRNQKIFFCEDETGGKARANRAPVFQNYINFISKNKITSPDPSSEISIYIDDHGHPFDLLLTNTSYFSDKEEDSSKPTTPGPLNSLRHHLQGRKATKPLIILGHHSPNTFRVEDWRHFETLLTEKKAIYLHGHSHEPQIATKVDGTIKTIGFGATYVASLDTETAGPYKNCFATCKFDEYLHLRCFLMGQRRLEDGTNQQNQVSIMV